MHIAQQLIEFKPIKRRSLNNGSRGGYAISEEGGVYVIYKKREEVIKSALKGKENSVRRKKPSAHRLRLAVN